uniref:Uncharacterized protein n=1 Tax=Pseudomonas fluorescens (strain SBW25) TaxID=216595 RepID=A0A0G4E5P0_PSEFS|nr:hypothetical protein PQBR55_0172 [Pseudomonas fluorescens SBW25]
MTAIFGTSFSLASQAKYNAPRDTTKAIYGTIFKLVLLDH